MGILTNFLKLLKPEPNDFVDVAKHISENYDKLDENAKSNDETLTNLNNNKLDKGTYPGNASDLNTEISKIASTTQLGRIIVGDNLTIDEAGRLSGKKVDLSNYYDKPEIEEKFKNFCPVPIGWLAYIDTEEHPATRYLGTTWVKLEDVFIKGTKSGEVSGQTGGSNTKTISKANLPNIKLQVDSFSVTTKKHTHGYRNFQYMSGINIGNGGNGTNWVTSQTGEAGGDNTGTASPYTSTLGSGTALDITPAYYTVHIWKRLS